MKTHGYAATAHDRPLTPFSFERRALRPDDVAVEILYSGICHSDLHFARNDWGITVYPVVPGHEIIGKVIEVGARASRHKIGDTVAVGTIVDSCSHCDPCKRGEQQLCRDPGPTNTFGGRDRVTGEPTHGGYAKHIVVREDFALRVPNGLDLSRGAASATSR